jgi:hypothetical protein
VLCKHEVSGSIPLSSTIIIRCFLIAAICFGFPEWLTPIRRQAGKSFETVRLVSTASGRAFDKEGWIFDNEIDWVMRIRHLSLVPAAARQLAG